MGLMPSYQVIANDSDITARVVDRLISLTLTDATGMESDILEIVLSDSDPADPLQIPPTGAELELFIGYDGTNARMGLFVCDEIELAGWPGEMTIRARAAVYDKSKKGKTDLQTQKNRSWPKDTKLADMVSKIAKEHGLKPAVAQSLQSITLPHIDQLDESDIHLLTRLAKQYDAIVKPSAGKLVLAKRGESKSTSGEQITPVLIHASNCARWRMIQSKRETAGMVVAYWQAVKSAKRKEVKVGSGEPVRRLKTYYPNEEMALAAARSDLQRRGRGKQTLAMTVIGAPMYAAEAPLTAVGFRAGIDGEWLITRVLHRIDPSSGYTCDIEAETPNGSDSAATEVTDD